MRYKIMKRYLLTRLLVKLKKTDLYAFSYQKNKNKIKKCF